MKGNWGIFWAGRRKKNSTIVENSKRPLIRRSTMPAPSSFGGLPGEICASYKAISLLGTFDSPPTNNPSHKANLVLGTFAADTKNTESHKANVLLGVVRPTTSKNNKLKKFYTSPDNTSSPVVEGELNTSELKRKDGTLGAFITHLEVLSSAESPANVPKGTILQMIDALGKTKDGVVAA
ncbi:hypothetical protein SARC_11380 [Sphaeroforma arctica JP610]|uniref:Uncharacterized protein n=1 Tax=Sphaeroforma arctica JP610 TaxID=667725 RepID=A0A0L0FH97_9EUKA|nr:hypothetical protein SARC_11380 [Sphaeroforma arctica JP610]KNC76110.1 hypothetical protein SARC_11380 [Sphaeroforma arctica JP610]|eukprot:XP_014150012.1 hypothetical protein SARC_11380 [Sphaeroforma arctica JP610]